MRTRRLIEAVLLAALGAAGCRSARSPAAPGAAFDVLIVFTPVRGTFAARLNRQDYATPGAVTANLAPGTYDIDGTFLGSGLVVGFATIEAGGVRSGSLRSLAGPAPQVGPCSVTYSRADTGGDPLRFRLEFDVVPGAARACGPPAP